MVVNLTEITTLTGFMDILSIINNNTSGFLGVFILLMIFGVTFMASYSRYNDPKDSFMAAAMVCSICAMFLFAFNILSGFVFFLVVSVSAVTIALAYLRR